MSLDATYLAAIQARLNAASPGEWRSYVEGRDHMSGSDFIMTGVGGERGEDIECVGATAADQDFIAYARQDVQVLLDEVNRLNGLTS